MNILVTGGAGYIGSVLTGKLLELRHKVTIVDNFRHGYQGIVHLAPHPNLEIVKRNILDPNRDYLKGKDFIFHLAAITSNKDCDENKIEAFKVNATALDNIAYEACKTPILYTSTTAVYGDRGGEIVDENTTVTSSAKSVYSRSKLAGEGLIKKYDNVIILRLGTVYGVSPLMRPHAIVNDFVRWAIQDGMIVIYGALTRRPYIHILDCVNGLIAAMNSPWNFRGATHNLYQDILSKQSIARLIHIITKCEVYLSKRIEEYPQDFMLEKPVFYCKYSLVGGVRDLIKLYSFYD